MKVFALVGKSDYEVVGFSKGKMVHWSKVEFANDPEILEELHAQGKAKKIDAVNAPSGIRNFAEILDETKTPYNIFAMELTPREAKELNNMKQHKYASVI